MATTLLSSVSIQLHPSLTISVEGQTSIYLLSQRWEEIGRSIQAPIRINHKEVSRHQAILVRVQGGYQIIDGDGTGRSSSNGTYVNGQRINTHLLKSGDVIHFGSNVVKAIYQDEAHAFRSNPTEIQTPHFEDDVTTELILLQADDQA